MKNIRVSAPYLHQGERLHPKLVYAVPDEVAEGMAALGLAAIVDEAADMPMPWLTWEADTVAAGAVAPAPLGHEQVEG